MTDCHVENFSPHEKCEENLSHSESSPHDKCGEMWRNLSCGEMFPHDRFLNMSVIILVCLKKHFLLQNLCCSNLRYFVAKSRLSRFTRFCVEKNGTKNFACGHEKTNIRYESGLNTLLSISPAGWSPSGPDEKGHIAPHEPKRQPLIEVSGGWLVQSSCLWLMIDHMSVALTPRR